ncbi:UNVERIFIED_CONTAM: hypothetical protein RMT77_007912 [Armadillidium vulgare]
MVKILIMGHSWVNDLEKEHNPEDFGISGVQVVYAAYPGANLRILRMHLENHLDETFSHVVIFTLITEAFKKINLLEGDSARPYEVRVSNDKFNLQDFSKRFGEFTQKCKSRCPGVKVWLMIPPYLDLIYYNQIQVRTFPNFLKSRYYQDARFSDHRLHGEVVEVYDKLKLLVEPEWQWQDKHVFPIMLAVHARTYHRNLTRPFMRRKIRTLGSQGYLRDGVHPSKQLIKQLWRKMNAANCFRVSSIIPEETHFEQTTPFVSFSVGSDLTHIVTEGILVQDDDIQEFSQFSGNPVTDQITIYSRLGSTNTQATSTQNLEEPISSNPVQNDGIHVLPQSSRNSIINQRTIYSRLGSSNTPATSTQNLEEPISSNPVQNDGIQVLPQSSRNPLINQRTIYSRLGSANTQTTLTQSLEDSLPSTSNLVQNDGIQVLSQSSRDPLIEQRIFSSRLRSPNAQTTLTQSLENPLRTQSLEGPLPSTSSLVQNDGIQVLPQTSENPLINQRTFYSRLGSTNAQATLTQSLENPLPSTSSLVQNDGIQVLSQSSRNQVINQRTFYSELGSSNTQTTSTQSFEDPIPSTSTESFTRNLVNLPEENSPAKRRKLVEEFEIEKEISKQVEKLGTFLTGYFTGKGHSITEKEVKRKMKNYLDKEMREQS